MTRCKRINENTRKKRTMYRSKITVSGLWVCLRALLLTRDYSTRVHVNCQTYIRGYVYVESNYNWRNEISHKRHIFICHVNIYALSAVYADLNILIHASESACE